MKKPSIRFGDCELQPVRRRLLVGGRSAEIGPRAFDVLLALVERSGDLVSKQELMACAWPDLVVEENNLAQQVSALRRLLGTSAIATIPALGYRFTIPVEGEMRRRASRALDALPSIAVLPFADLSAERNQEFFADGLAEEVLHVLARIRGLRVASRISSFSFKGATPDLETVSERLSVAWVLQGSVRKSAGRIRVAVQLVHAATDTPAWSQAYDREAGDVFAVQDEIARAVVKEIRPALFSSEEGAGALDRDLASAARGRATNAEAYRLYLHGKFFAEKSTRADLDVAIDYLRRAVAMEEQAARAWAALARAYATRASFGWAAFDEFERARDAARKAVELEASLAEGHAALAYVQFSHDWDWSAAAASMRLALDEAPGDPEILREAAYQVGSLGNAQEAVELARRAVELDPLSLRALRTLGIQCLQAGLPDESERAIRDALELFPVSDRTHYHLGRALLLQGRMAEALAAFEGEATEEMRLQGIPLALHALGRRGDFDAAMEAACRKCRVEAAFQIGEAYGFAGRADEAFRWLGRAIEQRDPGVTMLRATPLLGPLRADPRWRPLLDRLGFSAA